MKKVVLAVMAVFVAATAMGQQNQKRMLEQIAKLQIQIANVKRGYDIAKDGLNTITKWTNGEFDLHKAHFKSLKNVNPNIRDSEKPRACRELYKEIVNGVANALNDAQSSGMFVVQEIEYFRGVCDKLFQDCLETLDNLKMVTSDGQVEMTDDQRMKRVNEYYEQMQEHYAFAVAFCTDMKALEHARRKHKEDVEQRRRLFGLD